MKDDKDTQTVNLQLTPAYDQRDEISLYDICCIFIKYKLHIIAATLFFTIASLVYAFVVSPVYEAVAYLAPPNERDIAGLNIFYLDIEGLSIPTSPEKVFNKYLMNFYSRSIRRQYFDTNNLLEKLANKNAGNVNEEKVFENSFNNLLSFRKSDEDKNIILPQLMAKEAEHASLWLNEFIYFVDTETVSSLKKDVKKVIALKKQSINDNIILVREHAKKKRFDEIQRLSEKDDINSRTIENKITALKNKSRKELKDGILVLEESNNIAKKLGIGGPISFAAGNKSTESSDLLINLGDMPGYTRGFEALSAELEFLKDRKNKDSFIEGLRLLEHNLELLNENPTINALKVRKSDDPFIEKLRVLEQQLDELDIVAQQLDMDTSIISVKVDQHAMPPQQRIKPNRKNIVILGLAVGIMVGLFIALLLNFTSNVRERSEG